jgi:serine/threonine protein kinase
MNLVLAAMKPPLLEMNTFSALYHIVQNDPPCLLNDPKAEPWSEYFCSFTEQCLRKDPNQRLSTNACLNV